jgi:type II secretory pathway component PulK
MRLRRKRHSVSPRRRAVVLISVLVVVTILSLAAYTFSEMVTSEYKAADTSRRLTQAHALADSGVAYTMALLSDRNSVQNTLNGNPRDNSAAFSGQTVFQGDGGRTGRFSIVGPLGPDEDTTSAGALFRYGVIDESGKINLNSLLKWDPSGQKGHDLLMQMASNSSDPALQNLSEDVINSILDWLDPDDTPRENGAESDYYQTLNPPYNAKNGPLDSIDELLLVKGVTPQMLYGNDINRNGILDSEEDDGTGQKSLGLAAYFTAHTHESNVDNSGNPRIYVNDPNLDSLAESLTTALGEDMSNYIIAYRLYGGSQVQSGTGQGGAGQPGTGGATPPTGQGARGGQGNTRPVTTTTTTVTTRTGPGGISDTDRQTVTTVVRQARANPRQGQQQNTQIKSLFDLINSSVSVPSTDQGGQQQNITYPSPLNDPGQLQTLLPLVLDKLTTTQDTDLPGKVNVNTAPQAVLAAIPGLSETDVQNIIALRPDPSSSEAPDASFQTLAWLILEANLSPQTVQSMETYITARTQVYRVQSVGYFDGGGPTVRIEAVIDTNNGRPRVLLRRDLTELGKAFDLGSGQ